jgi:hypothetical protein
MDAILTMPPEAIQIIGRDRVAGFFATVPPPAGSTSSAWWSPAPTATRPWRPTCPTAAPETCCGYGIMVVTAADDQVATITGFPDPGLFPIFDVPPTP